MHYDAYHELHIFMCILTQYEVVYTESIVAFSLNLTVIVLISQKVKVVILFRQSLLLGTVIADVFVSWLVCSNCTEE